MKKLTKQMTALFVFIMMMVTMLPTMVFAAEYQDYQITENNLKHIQNVFDGIAEITEIDGAINIKLTSDVYGRILFSDDLDGIYVLDLNGKTIDPGTQNEAICLDNYFKGDVTVTGEGTLKQGRYNIIYGYGIKFAPQTGSECFTVEVQGDYTGCQTKEYNTTVTLDKISYDLVDVYDIETISIIQRSISYGIWVGGIEVTEKNLVIDNMDSYRIEGSATFEPSTYTLTLDNFKYEGAGAFKDGGNSVDEGIAIYYSNPEAHDDLGHGLDIVLIGENEIKCTSESGMCAIYIIGNTTISGSGSLVAEAMSADADYAIYIPSYLDINDATVTAISHGEGESSYGIFAGSLDVNNATVVASSKGQAILDMVCEYESRMNLYASLGGGVDILASYNADGTNAFPYLKDTTCDEHKTYKYIKIEPAAESDCEQYEVWLGGIQFTSENLVIDSTDNPKISGSATFEPSTYTLTLNNFKYEGMGYNQMETDGHFGIALWMTNPEYDIEAYGGEIVLIGENEITCVAEYFGSCAVYVVGSLNISGSGSLVAKATVSDSCDVEELEGAVGGIVSTSTLTINDASVTAITDVDYDAAYGITAGEIVLDNANITSSSDREAICLLNSTPFEAVIEGHNALVSNDKDGANATEYIPGMDIAGCKYVNIEPIEIKEPDEPETPEEPEVPTEPETPSSFDFTSIRTGNGKNISVDHQNKKISVEVTDSDNLVLYVHQKDIIPGGQIRLKSYNGNKVTYNSTGIYNIYSLYNKYITVYVNVTVDGVTEEYELTTKFGIRETETPFTSIRTQNGSVTEIDHENKKIYVRVDNGDDNLVLYVHQKDAIPGGQIRMKSYNGNKVTYDASGVYRIYTLGSDPIIVSAKVIIGNETLIYDIVADFNADKPDFNFDEIKCDNAEGMTIDHETKTIRIYAKDRANYVTLYRKQYDQIKGTVVLTSFMGNRVQSDLTEGTYKVCFVKNKEVSVKGKLTINDITEEYTIITVFYPEWKFDTLKIDSASSVEIDHESQKITVNASSDSVVLYIDQTATQGNAQVWMKDYNGNKVQYSADDRSYTITKGNEDSLTVAVKVTIYGETRYYDLILNF